MVQRFEPTRLRRTILEMAYRGSTVHIPSAFSIVELLAVLYRKYLRYPGDTPSADGRDYLVLSKGHGVMAQYACLFERGWIGENEVSAYFSDGSVLKGLSETAVAGMEVNSGSLGHGFSVGVGLSLAAKLKGTNQRTYVVVGDGELNEGPIWEAAMFSAHHELGNLMLIVDENGFQAMGPTQEVIGLGAIRDKFACFGFHSVDVAGHDQEAIDMAIAQLWDDHSKAPKALVAHTIKGKGVSFMEGDNTWHYTRLNRETYERAVNELGGQ